MFWATVLLVLALITSYITLAPRLSVVVDVSFDPKNAVASLFRVTNDGPFPIRDVNRGVIVHLLADAVSHSHISNSEVRTNGENVPELRSGESTTIDIPMDIQVGRGIYTDADIELVINFLTPILNWKCTKHFRFEARTGSDGTVRWFSKALSQ
jgi:hypothetical protein